MDAPRTLAVDFVSHRSRRPAELLRRLRKPVVPVAGLLVDLCGVLYDDSTWSRWLFKLVQRLGLHAAYTPFFRLWQCEYLERVKRGELEYWQALRIFLKSTGLSEGQIDEIEAASHARLRECESAIMPLPGAANVLAQLSERGIHLTMLSSACLDTQEVCTRLETLGLHSYFDAVLSVPDLWRQYPDHGVFEIAADGTHRPHDQLAFVGRDTAMLSRAGKAGICRIAVNYDRDAVAEIFVKGFDQLLDAVPWATPHTVVP